jgi:hypothetical protein
MEAAFGPSASFGSESPPVWDEQTRGNRDAPNAQGSDAGGNREEPGQIGTGEWKAPRNSEAPMTPNQIAALNQLTTGVNAAIATLPPTS